jgi:hypothetical protein
MAIPIMTLVPSFTDCNELCIADDFERSVHTLQCSQKRYFKNEVHPTQRFPFQIPVYVAVRVCGV